MKVFKNFTKKKFAGLLLILVIIVAFGLGGFGGGFNIGNQNNIAKINNINITTQDFIDYLNQSGLNQEVIKENIDKNVLEELLTTLVSTKLLGLEIEDLNLKISENILIEKIKKNKNFQDDNGKFQRTIYEKFLLTNNLLASTYELKLKNNILQKQLFDYISGGSQSSNFLINKFYKENNKKLTIDYIKLEKFYKNENEFTIQELENYINENHEKLKQDFIDFSYAIITPKNLTGLNEYDETFFEKIDEIENKISKNIDFNTIVAELNIKPTVMTRGVKKCQEIIFMNKKNKTRLTKTESIQPEDFIERFCNKLNIDESYIQEIIRICNTSIQNNIISENTPHSIAAGCIFYFIKNKIENKVKITKKDIALICKVSEVTINKCTKKLELNHSRILM